VIDRIVRSDQDAVATLTLNRPDKLNALDTQAFEELDAQLAKLETETGQIGCVVLRGAGRHFCSGADLNSLAPTTVGLKPRVIDRLAALPQPTIAAIHGACYTGAVEVALACDFIIADDTARFSDTHGKWGLVAAWGMTQRLPRRIGTAAAKRMMLTSQLIDAAQAAQLGLVDILVEAGGLDGAVSKLAGEIVANSSHTNFHTKRIMRETEGQALGAALAWEQDHYPGRAEDYADRVAAFRNARST
jgi:enoyl-CoA hydratase